MEGAVTREHGRYLVSLPVDCTTRDAFLSSRVTNLSRGGLFLEGEQTLPVGTEVNLCLGLPTPGAPILARGRVIWHFDIRKGSSRVVPGMGIKFTDLTADQERQIAEVLERAGTPQPVAANRSPARAASAAG